MCKQCPGRAPASDTVHKSSELDFLSVPRSTFCMWMDTRQAITPALMVKRLTLLQLLECYCLHAPSLCKWLIVLPLPKSSYKSSSALVCPTQLSWILIANFTANFMRHVTYSNSMFMPYLAKGSGYTESRYFI